LERLVALTLAEARTWTKGTFDFEPGLPESFDIYGDVPEGWVPGISSDTRGMVGAAMRIIEEHGEGTTGGGETSELHRTGEGAAAPETAPARALGVLSTDDLLRAELDGMGTAQGYRVFATQVRQDVMEELLACRTAGLPVALVVDLPPEGRDMRWDRGARLLMRQIHAEASDVPVLVLCEARTEAFAEAFDLGACAALPRPARAGNGPAYVAEIRAGAAAVLRALAGTWHHQTSLADARRFPGREMSLLREHVREMRQSSRSGRVSLVALRYVAALVDRCILFLVRERDLLGVGAFGLEDNEGVTAGLKLPIEPGSLLAGAIESGQLFHGVADEPDLAMGLHARIGAPASSEIVLVPLRAQECTAAIIYGDFGAQVPRAVDTEALEILAEFAGLAFDLALRERESGAGGRTTRIVAAS
jgi:ActR/RegA family two-component response regulator